MRSLVTGQARDVPDLVVVPGLGALGYVLSTVRACAAWTRLHLLDLPGLGHRTTAPLPADLASLSAVLAAWLAGVPERPVVLLGHSTGAQVALRAAGRAPEHVGRLVLAGATFPPPARRPAGLLVLHGERDRLCPPEWAAALAAGAPSGTSQPLPGAHNTPYTHPLDTALALRTATTAAA